MLLCSVDVYTLTAFVYKGSKEWDRVALGRDERHFCFQVQGDLEEHFSNYPGINGSVP